MEGGAQQHSSSEEQGLAGLTQAAVKARPGKSTKRPRQRTPTDDDVPDLSRFFEDHEMSKKQQIAICRTYANHLAAALRATEENM